MKTEADPEIRNSAVYWFFALQVARDRNDFERAAQAKRQLDRLGIRVGFRNNRRKAVNDA